MSDRTRIASWLSAGLLLGALWPALAHGEGPLRDPTRPPAQSHVSAAVAPVSGERGDFDLQAVFIAPDRRVAIINDERVRERDQIAGARVVRIHPDRVDLQLGGRRFQLELLPRPNAHPAPDRRPLAPRERNPSIERADP